MKLGIISGSHRKTSESGRVGRYVQQELHKLGHTTFLLDLAHSPLPLWDDGIWSNEPTITNIWKPLSAELAQCEAYVVISPEWHGMVPSGLKNLFLFCADGCMYNKPGLLFGVSAGMGGAYPISELRSSSYKNTHINYIPEHIIIRHVKEMLVGDTPKSTDDERIRKRIAYALQVLVEYGKGLAQVRGSGVLNRKDYPTGM